MNAPPPQHDDIGGDGFLVQKAGGNCVSDSFVSRLRLDGAKKNSPKDSSLMNIVLFEQRVIKFLCKLLAFY